MQITQLFPSRALALAVLSLFVFAAAARAQSLSGLERDRARNMLETIKSEIKRNYYDPSFHGIDLDAHFKRADEKLKQATSNGQAFGIIAQALLDFDDSHLYFVPPQRSSRFDYGWRMQMLGDKCFITAVKPGSDAEKKGLKPGDEIWSVDGFEPTRANHWKMSYFYYSLRPRPGVRLVVTPPGGQQREVDVLTKVTEGRRVKDLTGASATSSMDINDFWREAEDAERENRDRAVSVGEDLFVWKMSEFDLSEAQVDDVMGKARKHKALLLDLRGNSGGYEKTLLRLVGHFFDREVKVGDIKRRKESKPLVAATRGGDRVFQGPLVVLVDSHSGSAAELFARVVQLEKRGVVVGDQTPGNVMRSRLYDHTSGVDTVSFYGVSVTDADIVMTDGKSLERVGVRPDHLMLPTGADLAAGRDPVLAFAASLAGVKIDPEKAGAFFPPKWKK